MAIPKEIPLYRITHLDNLGHILKHGLVAVHSTHTNKKFRQIGDVTMIDFRKDLHAPDPPGGQFSEFIPFYLGPRSPMLYQIATGWEDIEKIHQQEIIYIISSFKRVKDHKLQYFFTDGHARSRTSKKYTAENDFKKLDWDAIYATKWNNDDTDLRRKEKKQAEVLIKGNIPVSCFEQIGVFNEVAEQKVLALLKASGIKIPIRVDPKVLYYDHL
jgi:hypothetical protein